MEDEPTDIAATFEQLRAEVSLCRRAVEGLAAEHERAPDYSATLGEMALALKATLTGLARIEGNPAVGMSPEAVAAEMVKASASARAEDVRLLHEARDTLSRSIGRVDAMVERGQAAEGQLRKLRWSAVFGLAAGVLLWSFLPGALARSLPTSWHVPEWMAARTMRADERHAGERLIRVAEQRDRRATAAR